MTTSKGKQIIVDRRRQGWHFEKKLSVDTLVAIGGIALVIGVPTYFAWRAMADQVLALGLIQKHLQDQIVQMVSDERERRTTFSAQVNGLTDKVTSIQIDVAKIIATQAQQFNRPTARN